MFAALLNLIGNWSFLLTNPVTLAIVAFQVWMLIHALRNREWLWALFIVIGSGLGALWYYFSVYRDTSSSGFELPGAQSRARVRELQAKIHHLDNAYHHFQLGDVYFQRGKFAEAEKCYRAAHERDPADIDTRAHLGQCLLRLNRPADARPLLEGVMTEKPDHDYGYTMMALAETLTALGETDNALLYWQHITQQHSYPRAKVQLAELHAARNHPEAARAELKDVLTDDTHAPAFQRARDRVWVRRARKLMGKLTK
ncbi:MAG TPA: tetratricopeptide repeat protein [Candidatus Acidoferrales bacterium]|nr:tetratricopeptide repeat protein [Candidatus Acidoferrales bacterium]